ncbi:hypothetical protein DXG01_002455 [Tephrocybe rancida]|nr:hypothetical protein DXG01_002455 [Tephrocybe rancida]
MHLEKWPILQELLDEEDNQAFKEELQAVKGKQGKGKKSEVKGPFKSGPIPKQAKQRTFAIHADFKKQIQDLAAEIGKAPQLLFSLHGMEFTEKSRSTEILASPQEWAKIVSTKHNKYCQANLGNKWEDPEALTKLFEPIVAWYLEKHETYVDELKLEGNFNKVIGKAETAFKYNGVHSFGFIVNLQPDHTGRTGGTMWGTTPAFEQMKIDEKGVISRQIAEWETLLRRADMTLNSNAEEHEKELWTVQIMSKKHNHARQAFFAWLGCDIEDGTHTPAIGQIRHTHDGEPLERCLKMTMPWSSWPNYDFEHKLCLIEWPMDACLPDGAYYDFKDAANGLHQVHINLSNRTHSVNYLDKHTIQISSWNKEDIAHEIDDSDLREVPLVISTICQHLITIEDSAKFINELSELTKQTWSQRRWSRPNALGHDHMNKKARPRSCGHRKVVATTVIWS